MAADDTSEKSLPALAAELWDLVRAYAKQETVEPMKGLGRYAAFGIGGSLLLSIGLVLLLLGGLRALQTQTGNTFDGSWSWAPYLISLAGTGLVIAVVARGMGKRKKS
jgi:formate-dependent nitrite reductase membrane component NrfD